MEIECTTNSCFVIITIRTTYVRNVFIFSHTLQVLILEMGERRFLEIGAVWKGYEASHSMPRWSKGTVGYHVEDGKIFHAGNLYKPRECKGNISRAFLGTFLTSTLTQGI